MRHLHDSPYILNTYLDQFQELVISRGVDFKRLCEQANLTVADVAGPTALIPFDRFISILELADQRLDLDDFSLKLASRQNISILGPISFMLVKCDSVKDAIDKIQHFLHLSVSGMSISFSSSADCFNLDVDVQLPSLQTKIQFHNYLIGAIVTILRKLYGPHLRIRSCELMQFDPGTEKRNALTNFLGCNPSFGSEKICLSMDPGILLSKLCLDLKSSEYSYRNIRVARQNIENSVREALIAGMIVGDTSIVYVSSLLGYSERTLRRRLNELSLSFSDILDAARIAQANKYLQSSYYRLSDIALLLGYSNQSAFTRSYARCCGITPSQFRNSLR
jgi:AraC-like DNA-binding protein